MIKNQSQIIRKLNKNLFIKKKTKVTSKDVLFIIDMQNDFIDRPYVEKVGTFSRPGRMNKQIIKHTKGKLPTHNSKTIIKGITSLMSKFKLRIATRDYHPISEPHCSFSTFGEHCVWNTVGSDIVKEIEKKMTKKDHIVFKAFNHSIDSFGAFPYTRKSGLKRICGCTAKSCPVKWTWFLFYKWEIQTIPQLQKHNDKIQIKNNTSG